MASETKTPAKRITEAMLKSGMAQQMEQRPAELTENALVVLNRRYLTKDAERNVIEDTEGMFHRVARNLAFADTVYSDSTENFQRTEQEFYQVMTNLEFLPNSPTLMNAGNRLQQLSACFVLPVPDSLDEIFEGVKNTALIHQSGGGTGFSFSRLRPSGDVVGSSGGIASGPVSFIRAFDTATDVVKQGGTRRGANMGILSVTHPDILEFIKAKKDKDQLNNFNISVTVTDEFMEKAKKGEDYDLINPNSGKATSTLNAKEVLDLIVEMAWETGDPGLVFIDQVNADNPNPQIGRIESTNPCGEQPLLPYESCNLGSINLARMVNHQFGHPEVDWNKLAATIETGVHMLDNVIDMNNYPIQQIADITRATRRIGIGVMGWADLLVEMGVRYDSEAALDLAETIMEFIQDQTHRASIHLANQRGVFPEWEKSIYNTGPNSPMLRNSAPVTIAPTGTISIIAGASSGIEPLFALSYVRNVMDNDKLIEVNPYLEAVAKTEGFYSTGLMEQLAETGSIKDAQVPQWVKDIFRVSQDIDPEWHIKIQAAFQKYTDNAVSKTINFPANATKEDIHKAYLMAYDTGCKGITVYRDGSKDEQVLTTGATREKQVSAEELQHRTNGVQQALIPAKRTTIDRPRQVHGITERVRTGHGNVYITVNFGEGREPFEIFSNLGKAGGCDSAQLEAISRLASMALRAGVDVNEIIYNLRGITCCPAWDEGVQVLSTPDAIALTLSRQVGQPPRGELPRPTLPETFKSQAQELRDRGLTRAPRCADCNGTIEFREGCMACTDPACGWNKCN